MVARNQRVVGVDEEEAVPNFIAGWRRQSLLDSGILSLGHAIWGLILGLATVPIMLHGLGLSAYGLYSLAFAIAGFGSFLDLGLGWTISKFVAEADAQRDHDTLAATLRAGALYHVAVGLVFLLLVVPLAGWLTRWVLRFSSEEAPIMIQVLWISGASFFCSSLGGFFVSTLRGLRRFALATGIAALSTTVSAGGAATAAWSGLGVRWAAAAQLFGAGVGLVLGLLICRQLLATTSRTVSVRSQLHKMLVFSIWNYLNRLIQLLVLQGDKVIIGRAAGAAVIPFYMVPFGIGQKINFLAGPAVTAIYPTAAAGQNEPEVFLRQYFSASRLLHVLTGAPALAVFFLGDLFLASWVGPRMAENGSFFLLVFTLGYWLISVGSLDGGCIEGWNRPHVIFGIVAVSLVLGIGIGVATYPSIGVSRATACGVAAWLCSTGIGQIVLWQRISRYPLRNLYRYIGLPLVEMALLGMGISFYLRKFVGAGWAGMAALPLLAVILASYGVFRTFSREDRRAIFARLSPWATGNMVMVGLREERNDRAKATFTA